MTGQEVKDEYVKVKELGKGTFGVVSLVKTKGGSFYACKEVGDAIDILVGVREMDVMYRIRDIHPNIVEASNFDLEITEDRYNIKQYIEYCSGGSLEELLEEESKFPDRGIKGTIGSIRNRLTNLCSIVHALSLLQEKGIYHMDIKTENILYRKCKGMAPEMCLCDFSNYYLKTPWKKGMEAPIIPIEAILYRPPEIGYLKNTWEANEKADVWAFGVVIAETLGGWEVVQKVDSGVCKRIDKIQDLVDRIKYFQTAHIKRNATSMTKAGLTAPHKLVLSKERIFREELGRDFGKTFSNDSSIEKELLMALFYGREFSSPEFIDNLVNSSGDYFQIRNKEETEDDRKLLERVFLEVLPRCFTVDYRSRISMSELYNLLSEIINGTSDNGVIKTVVNDNVDVTTKGLWERIPDPVWKSVVMEFYSCTKDLKINYGRTKEIPVPINAVLFAKRISEAILEKLMVAMDDNFIPKEEKQRKEFYGLVLTASVFIASELMDFIFPFESCEAWFGERHPLEKVAPYLKIIMDTSMGEIGTLLPNEEEQRVLDGEGKLE